MKATRSGRGIPWLLMAVVGLSISIALPAAIPATSPAAQPPQQFEPGEALLTNGTLDISGNPTINGSHGSVHANGNLTVSGNPTVSQNLTASGTLSISGSPSVGGTQAGNQPTKTLPAIDPQLYAPHADFFMKANGKVLDDQGVQIFNGSNGDEFNGWKYTGSLWEHVNDAMGPPATYFFETDVKVGDSPGTAVNPLRVTLIATGSVEISGNPFMRSHLGDVGIVSGGDIKISGILTPSIPGYFAAREQIQISGDAVIQGAVVAGNEASASDLVKDYAIEINGNPTITYNGGLQTVIPVDPPAPPVINTPTEGSFLTTSTPTISGSSEATGITVAVFIDGIENGTTTTGAGGTWSLTLPNHLPEGLRSFTAIASNSQGASDPSHPVTAVVDTIPPSLTSLTPPPNSILIDDSQTISTTWQDITSGIDKSTAMITLNGNDTTATSTITELGLVYEQTNPLNDGNYNVVIQVSDKAGNHSTATWSFLIDLAPNLTLTPAEGSNIPNDTPAFVATFSDPGSGIDLSSFQGVIDGNDHTSLFVTSENQGTYEATFTPSSPLSDGPHSFSASVSDNNGTQTRISALFRTVSAVGSIGSSGGTLEVTDTSRTVFGAKLEVPTGALSNQIEFSIESVETPPPLPSYFNDAGPAVDFLPSISFSDQVELTIPYDDSALSAGNVHEGAVRVIKYDTSLVVHDN